MSLPECRRWLHWVAECQELERQQEKAAMEKAKKQQNKGRNRG